MALYNLKTEDGQYRITKFDNDLNVESSYLMNHDGTECECPAGHRPSCRHRQMLPIMLAQGLDDSAGFYDFDHDQVLMPMGEADESKDDSSDDPINPPPSLHGVSSEELQAIDPINPDFIEALKSVSDNGSPTDFDSVSLGSSPKADASHPSMSGSLKRRI